MGYSSSQAKEFISHIAPIIQEESKKRGYRNCSATIAQAIIEGAAGTSSLAKNYHNHFGMKCGSKWRGKSVNLKTKEEYTVGTLTTIKDNFRAYDSDEEGISGYYDFISTSRYANLKSATSYKQFAQYLKDDGYATSSTYVNTLCSTVQKYNLDKYDTTDVYISSEYYPKYTGASKHIDEVLEAIGVDSTYCGNMSKRKPLALANGLVNYSGTASQNTMLIQNAKSGTLRKVII